MVYSRSFHSFVYNIEYCQHIGIPILLLSSMLVALPILFVRHIVEMFNRNGSWSAGNKECTNHNYTLDYFVISSFYLIGNGKKNHYLLCIRRLLSEFKTWRGLLWSQRYAAWYLPKSHEIGQMNRAERTEQMEENSNRIRTKVIEDWGNLTG